MYEAFFGCIREFWAFRGKAFLATSWWKTSSSRVALTHTHTTTTTHNKQHTQCTHQPTKLNQPPPNQPTTNHTHAAADDSLPLMTTTTTKKEEGEVLTRSCLSNPAAALAVDCLLAAECVHV
jgi:hypothetical protein